jgi:hypothetical protein
VRRISSIGLALAATALLAACDEDPVVATDLIVIQLSGIKEGDVADGVVSKSKNVSTESGNPYHAFLVEARAVLGRDPSRIRVDAVQITLDGSTTGIASFADLFNADAEVFLDADVGGTVAVARVTGPTGTGPVTLEVVSTDETLAPIMAALLSGDFRVGVRGTTLRTSADDFDARVDVRIGFGAYE